ncbi:DNA-binding NarL/FixJ family response regulator [Streptacidiphilus sp. EB129]|jgi:DNA-binding NarL/FixJ family response regulator
MSLTSDGTVPGTPSDPTAREPLRIVVADDAVLLREGLVRLLAEDGHEVVAAVGDGPGLVEAVLAHRPDVSVVDVRMPPTHTDEGLRAAITARGQVPGAPIMVLSQYVEVSYAADLLADGSGAVGYLLKDRVARVEEFLDALDRVARGATVLDPQVVAQLLAGRRRDDPLGALTARERQLLALMAEGHSNRAIARRLVLSNSAVEKHIGNVFAKLGLPPDDAQHRRVLAVLAYLNA